jgi:hypothetical protein
MRAGKGPFRNISLGGEHLHRYMRGIGLLSGAGAVAIRGAERLRRHPAEMDALRDGMAPPAPDPPLAEFLAATEPG